MDSVATESFVFIFAVAAFFASFQIKLLLQAKKRADLIRETPTTPVGKLREGYYEAKGVVAEIEETDLLVSPLTKKKCVYYNLELLKLQSAHTGSSRVQAWSHIIDDSDFIVFTLTDDTGDIYVDVGGAEMNLKPDKELKSGGAWTDPPAELEEYLKTRNMTAKCLSGSLNYICRETVLEPQDKLYVLGSVIRDDDKELTFFQSDELYYISDTDENSLLEKLDKQIFRHFLYTAVIFCGAFILYIAISYGR